MGKIAGAKVDYKSEEIKVSVTHSIKDKIVTEAESLGISPPGFFRLLMNNYFKKKEKLKPGQFLVINNGELEVIGGNQ